MNLYRFRLIAIYAGGLIVVGNCLTNERRNEIFLIESRFLPRDVTGKFGGKFKSSEILLDIRVI